MGIIIVLVYLIVLIACIFLVGYLQLNDGDNPGPFVCSVFWPIALPIVLIVALGLISYSAGQYIKEKPNKEFLTYIKEDVL